MLMNKAKRFVALVLALLLLAPCVAVSADAASVVTVRDEQLKEHYLAEFNRVVNAVKNNRPGVTVLATGTVAQSEDDAEDTMASFAKTVVENVFSNDQSLAADLIANLKGEDYSSLWETADVHYDRGALNMAKVPVSNKDYVSALTTKYNFTMKMLRNDSKQTTEILIQFPECTLLDALNTQKSDLSKVFDLPKNTDVTLNEYDGNVAVLEGGFFQLDDIICTNAYVDIKYNDNLELISYTSNINYRIKVSTYTVLEKLWPTFFEYLESYGIEVGALADFNIVSLIMKLISLFTDFDPEAAMSSVYTDYNIMYQMYELDWTPHYFGDVDKNNLVTADDARTLLRTSVGLASIKNEGDRFFADMDFDGAITAGDARIALRVSVGLEKKYTTYEMRQAQLEGNWENPDEPQIPDTPPVEVPDEPEVPEIPLD